MAPVQFSAREQGREDDYFPLGETALSQEVTAMGGSGAAHDPNILRITVRNCGDQDWHGIVKIDLPFSSEEPRFYLPGFLYGTNRGEAPLATSAKVPRLRKGPAEFPASPWWLTRSDRLSHPAALAFTGSRTVGLCASPYFLLRDGRKLPWKPGEEGAFLQYAGFGCDLERRTVSYTLGYENAPWFFPHSRAREPRAALGENTFTLAAGEKITFSLAVFDTAAEDERSVLTVLEWVYRAFHQSPRRCQTPGEAVGRIAQAVFSDAWLPEKKAYSGFVFDKPEGYELRPLPSISWTNGLSAATPMLLAGLRLGREDIRAQAICCIDHIVGNSINPRSGLPYSSEDEGGWSNRGWWYDSQPVPGHPAYLVGQAVYLVLKAYEHEKRAGVADHPDWLEFAEKVISVTERSRNGDGEYPYILSENTGAGLCYDSFSGAWCMAAAACYCRLTGDRAYLPGLLDSEAYYHRAFISHLECYGGPLDIDKQIDSEGILAYIRAVRCLHTITGDPLLLKHMYDALRYEFTFKFCYNSPIKVPPLSRLGWSSCGGSITSVANPHIHPMSSSVIDEMLYFVKQTGNAYVRSRMEDTILWSCQVSNTYDREYDYGKVGWMSERFAHCQGLLTPEYPDGSLASTWFALMPWACGSILEGLCGELKWVPEKIKIAVVCDVLGEENNGTTIAAMNLIQYLKKRGHEVRVVCPDEERRGEPGYYVVPQLNVGPLNDYVQKVGVSIAMSDDGVLEQALRGVDAVHIMTPFFLGKAALDIARKAGIPVTAGFHCQAENITSHLHLMNSRLVNNLTYKAMYQLVYQYVDAIHYPTQFIRETFEKEVGWTNGYVISNGVNRRFRKAEAERPEAWKGKFVILFTGRFGYEKSHKVLIDAVSMSAHENGIQLIFAGEGPLREELADYGKKLTNPPFLHFFSREEMLRTVNCADLYVHPAEVEIEAIACLEAISCGLVPVIADSPRSATRFFALDEKNLFHFNDPADLAGKIDYWIDHPEEKENYSRRYLGYTKQFEQDHCMAEMENMIRQTIAEHTTA